MGVHTVWCWSEYLSTSMCTWDILKISCSAHMHRNKETCYTVKVFLSGKCTFVYITYIRYTTINKVHILLFFEVDLSIPFVRLIWNKEGGCSSSHTQINHLNVNKRRQIEIQWQTNKSNTNEQPWKKEYLWSWSVLWLLAVLVKGTWAHFQSFLAVSCWCADLWLDAYWEPPTITKISPC